MTKQTKILFSVVLCCTFLVALAIPSFAQDEYVLEAGTYVFNSSLVSPSSDFTLVLDFESRLLYPEGAINSSFHGTSIQVGNNSSSPTFGMVYYGIFEPSIPGVDGGIEAVLESEFTFDSLRTIHITSPVSVSSDIYNFFDSNTSFTPDPSYDGNPFTDIMNMVIEALDVPLFGTFSLWDMLTTVCGLFAVVWLLKLLAGG